MALDRFRIIFEDRMLSPPARMTVSALSVRGENISNAKNSRGKVTDPSHRSTIKERYELAGTLGTRPVAGRLNVDARGHRGRPLPALSRGSD